MNIKLKDKNIEVTLREHDCNISHLVELISLFGEFKTFPKKFKEIFSNYLRVEYSNATTQNKIQIIPPSSTLTTNTGDHQSTDCNTDFHYTQNPPHQY